MDNLEKQAFLLPEVDWPLLQPFWQAALRDELVFPHCQECGHWQWYPAYTCPRCGGELVWESVSKQGTLYSWANVNRVLLPEYEDIVPYTVALVDIDDAPGVRLIVMLKESDPEQLRLGMSMEIFFEAINEETAMPRCRIKSQREGQ